MRSALASIVERSHNRLVGSPAAFSIQASGSIALDN